MIIINLKGGLGNQMFQYAIARALSLKNSDILKLDISSLSNAEKIGNVYRPFSLQNFNIKAEIASDGEVNAIKNKYGIFSEILRKISTKFIYHYYASFYSQILAKKGNIYLDGYFQSEKYFIDYENEIRDDLTLREDFVGKAKEWNDKIIKDENSVSIHVRRSDYLTHKEFGGICTKEYFEKAYTFIIQKYPNSNFYIFSDDIDWVKDNLNIGSNVNYVSLDKLQDFEDLILMSKCKHNIISNSSFSFFGAWLNNNKEKTVVAPKEWVNISKNDFKDIVPFNWTRI